LIRAVTGNCAALAIAALLAGRTITGVPALLAQACYTEFLLFAVLVGIAFRVSGVAARDYEQDTGEQETQRQRSLDAVHG
jgi:hypothetical protein